MLGAPGGRDVAWGWAFQEDDGDVQGGGEMRRPGVGADEGVEGQHRRSQGVEGQAFEDRVGDASNREGATDLASDPRFG